MPEGKNYEENHLKFVNKYLCNFFFGLVPIGILEVILIFLNITFAHVWAQTKEQIYIFTAITTIFFVWYWVYFLILFTNLRKSVRKKFESFFKIFKNLINTNYLDKNLSLYPDMIKMSFYVGKSYDWNLDFPNSYPNVSVVFSIHGLCIFFDRLRNFLKNNAFNSK